MEEVTATAPEIPVVVQVEPRGEAAVEAATATRAEAVAAVVVASTCLLAALFAADRGTIGEKAAKRRGATSYPGVPGTQTWPRREFLLIGRGGTGGGAASIRKRPRRGSSGVRGNGGRQVQCDDWRCIGGVALDKQVVQYIADSAATCNMTPDAHGLTNYRECSRPLGLANGETISIVGYSDLTVNLRTDHGWVRVEMNNVAHDPLMNYNLISLPSITLQGHTYTGDKYGITLKLNRGEIVFSPLVGKLYRQYGYRPEATGSMVDTAYAPIAPGKAKGPTTPTDTNILHCTFGHTHEVLVKKTATQQGIAYSGEVHECRGCSMAKGLRKTIARSTHTRAAKKLQRVFVDLSGLMTVQSTGGKRYLVHTYCAG